MKILSLFIVMIAFFGLNEAICQWNTNDNHIYNANSGNVGIGNSAPTTLLHVAKITTEPTITVQNLGGTGGATYVMMDNASGAYWKFKATNSGGFKIRDHANMMDVITIEPNSFANAIFIKTTDNMGIGTATPDNSALVDMTSTTKGFLQPRMTLAQIQTIPDPANGLMVYCTTDDKFYVFVSSANAWKEILYGTGTISLPPFSCGSSITINHVEGAIAPVTKTVTYGTVTNIYGESSKCWITSNLGADHQATAVDDATEESAGWYWQFNRMQGYKHDGSAVTPAWTITLIEENSNWLPANDPCTLLLGNGWRLPTHTEWTNIYMGDGWWNWNGPWNSALKMHAAGQLINGLLYHRGYLSFYWSSSQHLNEMGWCLYFHSLNIFMSIEFKNEGKSIRCLRD